MPLWELIAVVSAMATFTGVWLAVYALINNRTLKTETRLVRESLKEESRLTRESMKEESRLTREILDRIDSHIERSEEHITRLIAFEGDKTRALIKTTS
ncbi:MAG: hypothetical protein HY880_09650 [Deltaproteobacteria bacterium]|nr:hypothetical protein [Deltaproteobacteria bacterium]